MDFLKSIFGDKALTYAELEASLNGNKEVKLGNLASGQYVDKSKLDTKISELATANQTIQDLQETVKKFDGVDVTSLNRQIGELQSKYDTDTAKIKLDSAVDLALVGSRARNIKAVKALLDSDIIKLDGDKVLGLDDQLTKLKTEAAYLFEEQADPSKVKVDSGKTHEPTNTTEATTLLGALQEKYNS